MGQQNHARASRRFPAFSHSPRRANRLLIIAELIIVLLVIAVANLSRFLSFNETLLLFLFGWVSLKLRGLSWQAVGLKRPAHWRRTLLLGIAAGVCCQFSIFLGSLIVPLTGSHLDLSRFDPIKGNVPLLLLSLLKVWTLTAFGEELVYRGYLMNRMAELAGGSVTSWALSCVIASILFGVGHLYQGLTGVVAAGLGGLVYGALYLWSGRNLWMPIIAHGVFDTVAFVLIFWGKYPGL
jgi:uncharacterized protein